MNSPPAKSDKAGYIYALRVASTPPIQSSVLIYDRAPADPHNPNQIRIKVGRTNNVQCRLREHRRKCPSSRLKLLGSYPPISSPQQAHPVPFCDRLERLVHTELTDLSVKSTGNNNQSPPQPCNDCMYFKLIPHSSRSLFLGREVHNEIFTFTVLPTSKRHRDWSLRIRPVISRWAKFIYSLV